MNGIVALVARREFDTRVRTRSFVIGLVVTVVLLAGILVVPGLLGGDGDQRVGLVDDQGIAAPLRTGAEAAGLDLTVSDVPSADAGTAAVRDGDLDAVLVPGADGYRVVVAEELDDQLGALLRGVLAQQAVAERLTAQDVDPSVLSEVGPPLRTEALDPPQPGADERTGIAFVVIMLMYFQLLGFGITVAMGVVEEKSSRIVEVLLSTIRPWQLLLGKVLGIGAAGLLQFVAIGVAGLVIGRLSGVVTLTGVAVEVFFASLGWFLLGFLFYSVLYAAGGSLVSRQEDVGTVTTPMTLLILAPFLVAVGSLGSSGGISATLAWIPPFSPILMPLQQARGEASAVMVIVAAVLMLALTALVTWIGGRVYGNSVLRLGSRVSLRDALAR